MDIESIKEMAISVNNVAASGFQSGLKHSDKLLLDRIAKLEARLEAAEMFIISRRTDHYIKWDKLFRGVDSESNNVKAVDGC